MNTAKNQHTNAMLDSQQHDVFLWISGCRYGYCDQFCDCWI